MERIDLEVKTAITKKKAIILGRTVILFGRPRVAVGFLHDAIVFAVDKPRTVDDCRVLAYTPEELAEFLGEGKLEGAVDL